MHVKRCVGFIVIAVLGTLLACGNPKDRPKAPASAAAAPATAKAPVSDSPASTTPDPAKDDGEMGPPAPPLMRKETVKQDIPEYKVPDRVRERINKLRPELLPTKTLDFQVLEQNLIIDPVKQKVTFTGKLRIADRQDETFELACNIDMSLVPWECRNMSPTSPAVAAERRLQGTFECLDTYICDRVGVGIYVVVNGKLQGPKLFQAQGFMVRPATSGDVDEDLDAAAPDATPPPTDPPMKDQEHAPGVEIEQPPAAPEQPPITQAPVTPTAPPQQPPQKPPVPPRPPAAPAPVKPPPVQRPPPPLPLTDAQIEALLDDPDTSVEVSLPMTLPPPEVGKYSPPGIEKLQPPPSPGTLVQAVDFHDSGHLEKAVEFSAYGPGFIARDRGQKDFATDVMVDVVSQTMAETNKRFPDRPAIVIGNVAKKMGGPLTNQSGQAHGSHQTGLDADIGFPSTTPVHDLFYACGSSEGCHRGSKIVDNFDTERFWYFVKQITCNPKRPVMLMFIQKEIKAHMCDYVKQNTSEDITDPKSCAFHALQALVPGAEHSHVHVRLHCPEHSRCRERTIILKPTSGC